MQVRQTAGLTHRSVPRLTSSTRMMLFLPAASSSAEPVSSSTDHLQAKNSSSL